MATLTDDNTADGNLDKLNMQFIKVDYTSVRCDTFRKLIKFADFHSASYGQKHLIICICKG